MTVLRLFIETLDTPIGRFALVTDEAGCLRAAGFTSDHARMARQLARYADRSRYELASSTGPSGVGAAVRRYFDGDLASLDGVRVAFDGTPFQCQVWRALGRIPCGETRTYAAIAREIGRPRAVRAVGAANGDNPIALVLPCHRVSGSDGSLTGYGGGIARKRWLLGHERAGRSCGARSRRSGGPAALRSTRGPRSPSSRS
ncbi:MAG: methylated-DNA--[protein]-cysteine S-methyltransferase [Polyangiaceae bacterium]